MKADLDDMLTEISAAPDVARPSRMWERVASRNLEQLRTAGIGEFKRTIKRHAAGGYFHTKEWRRWHNPDDDITVDHDDHPFPTWWRVVFDRQHPIQTEFFEALCELRAPRAPGAGAAGQGDPVEIAKRV